MTVRKQQEKQRIHSDIQVHGYIPYTLYLQVEMMAEIGHRFAGTDRKVPAQKNVLTSEKLRATCQQNPPVNI